jgi:hypothetical protein
MINAMPMEPEISDMPVADLRPRSAISFALTWHIIGLLLMASHVLLVKQSIWLFPVMPIVLVWLYVNAPLAGLLVYFQLLLYQNCIISLLADGIEQQSFVVLEGTNFIALGLLAAVAWLRLWGLPWRRTMGPLLLASGLALGLAVFYSGIGAVRENPTSASIYFRETTALVLAVLVGLDIGRIWSYHTVAVGFLISAVLSVGMSVMELIAPIPYYSAINAAAYMMLKNANNPSLATFYSARDVLVGNTSVWFNYSDDPASASDQLRYMGSLMHSISNAYIIAIVGVIAWSVRQGLWVILLVPLLVLSGVKGANLMVAGGAVLWAVWYLTHSWRFLLTAGTALMVAYVAFGIISGTESGDYHVLGLLGGVYGFVANPLGHGIGVGGNLSGNATAGVNWQAIQAGGAADFGLESAVGVLLYQMGVASLAIFAIYFLLLKMAPFGTLADHSLMPRRYDIMFIILACVAVNGIFQEEAYTPYAAGMITLCCGILVANGRRAIIEPEPVTQTLRPLHV